MISLFRIQVVSHTHGSAVGTRRPSGGGPTGGAASPTVTTWPVSATGPRATVSSFLSTGVQFCFFILLPARQFLLLVHDHGPRGER